VTVLLIATTTGYQIRSFADAAKALGIRLVIASDRCDHLDDPWRDGAIAVRFHEPGVSAVHLKSVFGDERPDGILAVGDRPTLLAAHAAAIFGLPGNSAEAATRSRNKLAARDAFRSVGLLAPSYTHTHLDSDARAIAGRVTYPVVVKPLGLSGSRGVMRADTPQEFVAAFARLRRLLQSPDIRLERDQIHESVLIESFIPGREYAVEGVLTLGAFTPFAIFDKPDPLDGPFFEETIYVTPSRAPETIQRAIVDAVGSAARVLGLAYGPVHAECRVNGEGVYILEIAARPIGGLCSRALRFTDSGTSVSLEHVLLRHAIGEPIDGIVLEERASGVMMIPIPHRGVFRGVEGVAAAQRVALIDDVQITAKRDAVLTPLPEGRSYLGFIFAKGDSPGRVEAALRDAHRRLAFVIDRELPVVAQPASS
jgi:formate-dependent phosphoribosylglycinamide formyltransferase (GAR transformylase)